MYFGAWDLYENRSMGISWIRPCLWGGNLRDEGVLFLADDCFGFSPEWRGLASHVGTCPFSLKGQVWAW